MIGPVLDPCGLAMFRRDSAQAASPALGPGLEDLREVLPSQTLPVRRMLEIALSFCGSSRMGVALQQAEVCDGRLTTHFFW